MGHRRRGRRQDHRLILAALGDLLELGIRRHDSLLRCQLDLLLSLLESVDEYH